MNFIGYRNLTGMRGALPPRYFGNIAYYLAVAAHGGEAFINPSTLFDKRQKAAHRFEIADIRGIAQLTVPIVKPHGVNHATWDDVKISTHGQWWHVMVETLKTAYGRSPFFEFYIDRFLPFMSADTPDSFSSVLALDRAVDSEIRKLLLLPQASVADCAETLTAQNDLNGKPLYDNDRSNTDYEYYNLILPYWQVPSPNHPFIPNLSILDLIFNLGSEAPLYIARICAQINSLPQTHN